MFLRALKYHPPFSSPVRSEAAESYIFDECIKEDPIIDFITESSSLSLLWHDLGWGLFSKMAVIFTVFNNFMRFKARMGIAILDLM